MLSKQEFERMTPVIGLVVLTILGLCRTDSEFVTLEADPPKAQPARNASPPTVTVYDPDPQHLWNRLYSALYVRVAQDGKAYGQDLIDPLLWPSSKHLLTQPRNRQAISLLDEFLTNHGEKLIRDPLKRAFLQRDLWAIFDWLADPHLGYSGYPTEKTDHRAAERKELEKRLAQVIQRLALSREQIQALPDNHAAAVAARIFPTKHDSSDPEKAFLPPDLLTDGGPWLVLAGLGPATPNHVAFAQGRSAFFVLMNLPKGRKETVAYLEKLNRFPNPLTPRSAAERSGHVAGKPGPLLNPNLPQFPPGTQFALVRQMMVIDEKGKIRPTRLIESVQLRVFRDVARLEGQSREELQAFETLVEKQKAKNDFYEFQLRRGDLFADKAGGLHAVKFDEEVFSLFSVMDEDFFESHQRTHFRSQRDANLAPGQRASTSENLNSTHSCNACHGQGPGIHGVLSYRRIPPPELLDSSRRDQVELAIDWKWHRYSWGLLQGLLENKPTK